LWLPQVLGNLIVLKVGMEDLNVSGKMRITMRPLLDRPPVVGALKVHFGHMQSGADAEILIYGPCCSCCLTEVLLHRPFVPAYLIFCLLHLLYSPLHRISASNFLAVGCRAAVMGCISSGLLTNSNS
jgi:hypothetical protein